jgi:hypothetical protein
MGVIYTPLLYQGVCKALDARSQRKFQWCCAIPMQPIAYDTAVLIGATPFLTRRPEVRFSQGLICREAREVLFELSAAWLFYRGVAGIPHTLELLGMSRLTSDIAPITTRSPIVMPFCITDCGLI